MRAASALRSAALNDRALSRHIAAKRSQVKAMAEGRLTDPTRKYERHKVRTRSRLEHPLHVVKNLLAHKKVRYKELKKNRVPWQVLFALANLYRLRKASLAR